MKIKSIAGKLLAITLMLGFSQVTLAKGPPDPDPAPCNLEDAAVHDHACRLELKVVFDTIGGALSGNDRDASKLQSKVCAADSKVEIGKTEDAVQKLQNIIDTVNTKAKIDAADAAEIAAEAQAAADAIASGTCATDI